MCDDPTVWRETAGPCVFSMSVPVRRYGLGLADLGEELGEPGLRDVERLATLDALERDRLEPVVVLLVVADDARLAAQRGVDREVGHRLDEVEVVGVGGRGARVVAALLDHDLLNAE